MNNEVVVQPHSDEATRVRVLIADTSEALLAEYQKFLSRVGFEVVTASSGLQCIARLYECMPAVLVLEPQLPWGGGDGVLAMMREVPDLAAIPVMILTSCRDPRVLDRVAPFPISDYHVKPLAPDRLAIRIRHVLDYRRQQTALVEQGDRLKRCIEKRTGGRIHNLRVENLDRQVTVRGCSSSFFVRQLALAAVMESGDWSDSELRRVAWDIEVCGCG